MKRILVFAGLLCVSMLSGCSCERADTGGMKLDIRKLEARVDALEQQVAEMQRFKVMPLQR